MTMDGSVPNPFDRAVRIAQGEREAVVAPGVVVTERPDPSGPIDRIAVFRANNIGDFVAATPAFRALRASFPQAEITLIASPRVRPLVERLDCYLDRFLEFPGFPGIRERPFDAASTMEFLRDAQARRFDLAIQMHGSGVWSNPFVALLGAATTVGFARPEDSAEAMGLDRSVPYVPRRHETLRLLDLLAVIGVPPAGIEPELRLRAADHEAAARILEEAGVRRGTRVVAVHPGGRFPDRMWPPERFAVVVDELARRYSADVLLTGGPGDESRTAVVAARSSARTFDLTNRLSLPTLAALLCRLDLFVTNDTGPAHIAYAVGAPSVTLFGVAPADEWGSFDRERHGAVEAVDHIGDDGGGVHGAIEGIDPDAVLREAERVLTENGRV